MDNHWWQHETAYQIWPKSFADSNGDGIGDLNGITGKLDYLRDLGIGILWISPIYQSPLADEGYDISDYYKIDPRFGTMEDFDRLLAEADERDIHIIMDLVLNHCSDEHEWFRKACQDPDGPFGRFFYIRDWNGTDLPTNWRSFFGGPVWSPLPGHPDKVYLHSFHEKQPDLNWENPELRAELYKMINWWLDKGVSGFRLDAIINIKKPAFKNYPADREDGLCALPTVLKDQEGIGEFLTELKTETFEKHNAFTVGEVFDFKPDELPLFIGPDGYFSTMFDFSAELAGKDMDGWYKSQPFLLPDQYRKSIFDAQKACGANSFLSNIIENHDEPRGVNHLLPQDVADVKKDKAKKALAGVYFLLRGLPFIYQGQEIGMENVPFKSIEEVDDISTIDQYKVALAAGLTEEEALKAVAPFSRDNARTPIPWNSDLKGGFTEGTPWMRLNPNNIMLNVDSEQDDPSSVLSFYKRLIRLRSGMDGDYENVLTEGMFLPYLENTPNLISYFRWNGIKTLLIMANFQAECQNIELPDETKIYHTILTNEGAVHIFGNTITLTGWQFVVLEMQ